MKEEEASQSIILCEGYHDRSFWAGLLTHLGCESKKKALEGSDIVVTYMAIDAEGGIGSISVKVIDPNGKKVTGGEYGYYTASGKFVRIVCAKTKEQLWKAFDDRVNSRQLTPRLSTLIFNTDSDVIIGADSPITGIKAQDILTRMKQTIPPASLTPEGDIDSGDGLTVSLVRWETNAPDCEWLPRKQTLERLVYDAICSAYPDRIEKLKIWLKELPRESLGEVKTFAWSLMAGWHADHSCDDFYRLIWRDPKIAAVLINRLVECRAWRVAQLIAS